MEKYSISKLNQSFDSIPKLVGSVFMGHIYLTILVIAYFPAGEMQMSRTFNYFAMMMMT